LLPTSSLPSQALVVPEMFNRLSRLVVIAVPGARLILADP
jgi:hypothetical protein